MTGELQPSEMRALRGSINGTRGEVRETAAMTSAARHLTK